LLTGQLKPLAAHFHVEDGSDLQGLATKQDAVCGGQIGPKANVNAVGDAGLQLHGLEGFTAR
jgi:hypothetical protein